MFDKLRVFFQGGSETVIYVDQDWDLFDAMNDLCEGQGWTASDIVNYRIEDTVESE